MRQNGAGPKADEQHQIDLMLAFFAGRNRFGLGLATYDDRPRREQFIERITKLAAKQKIVVSRLVLTRDDCDLLAPLKEHLAMNPSVARPEFAKGVLNTKINPIEDSGRATQCAVMVVGIEESVYAESTQPGYSPALFGNANMMREAFTEQCPVPIVLWLMPAATALLTQTAPDFWHWRAATFDFTSPESERQARERSLTSMGEHERLALPRGERDKNITMLGDLLKQAENADDADSPRGCRRRWELLNQLGQAHRNRADFQAARHYHEQALALAHAIAAAEPDGKPDHPQISTSLNNLGLVLQDLGDLPRARQAFERALNIDEKAFGPDHPEVATDVNNLGGVLQDLGDLPGARQAFERALNIDERAFGPDHPNVATSVNNLGSVLHDLGDLPAARQAYERALKIDERAFGPDHPNVATSVNNLGSVLQDLGDLPRARQAFERALGILRKVLGDEHPNTEIARRNLQAVKKSLSDQLQGVGHHDDGQ